MEDRIRKAVEKYGEVMIRTDSGEDFELHKHNADFKDDGVVEVDADDEVHWLDLDKVERYWIHYDF
ncbi:MAG: hypothetical protein ABEK01_02315 [Candidatus Nanohaloarchaea archaeon]